MAALDTKMNQTRKVSKASKTREKIIDCYLDMIPKKKWDKISVKEICSKAEITRGTFYQYFDDIYNLIEEIERPMLEDLERRVVFIKSHAHTPIPPERFEEKFDYTPPEALRQWFRFCQKFRKPMARMLDRKNGDTYFIKKIKVNLTECINYMMDEDGMPHDALREYFVKIFLELHFLAASVWLTTDADDEFLSIKEIINLLNTMRVGANYLTYKRITNPDFDLLMSLDDGE